MQRELQNKKALLFYEPLMNLDDHQPSVTCLKWCAFALFTLQTDIDMSREIALQKRFALIEPSSLDVTKKCAKLIYLSIEDELNTIQAARVLAP